MLKVRIQGTVYDLNWAMEEMEKSDKLTVLSISKIQKSFITSMRM